ncbi:hypothetical protein GE21DRAFT_1277421 [Neurospora crassa]|nr:hypothetical protein GE21DRAFT_1277421 [Neurospora crassa]
MDRIFCIVLFFLPNQQSASPTSLSRLQSNSPALCLTTSLDILRPLGIISFNFRRDLSLVVRQLVDVENRPSFRQHKIAPGFPTAQRARLNKSTPSPRSKLCIDNISLSSPTVQLPREPASRIIAKSSETTRPSTASRLCALRSQHPRDIFNCISLRYLHLRFHILTIGTIAVKPSVPPFSRAHQIIHSLHQHNRASTMSSTQPVIMPPTMVTENLQDIMYAANEHQRKVYWSILGLLIGRIFGVL